MIMRGTDEVGLGTVSVGMMMSGKGGVEAGTFWISKIFSSVHGPSVAETSRH